MTTMAAMAKVAETPPGGTFQNEAAEALLGLQGALRELLDRLPFPIRTAADLRHGLSLDPRLPWRVFKVATARDPLAVGHLVPGPAAMRRFLAAAGQHGAPTDRVKAVQAAHERFERVIAAHAGERSAFASMISSVGGMPATDELLRQRRTAFRANSAIYGMRTRTVVQCLIHRPSTAGGWMDVAALYRHHHLHFLRPRPFGLGSKSSGATKGTESFEPFDRESFERHGAPMIPEFCSQPMPPFQTSDEGLLVVSSDEIGIGNRSAVDLAFGWVQRKEWRPHDDPDRCFRTGFSLTAPAEVLLIDVLAPAGMFDAQTIPPVVQYNCTFARRARDRHPQDRLDLTETATHLGTGISAAHTLDAPRHTEFLQHVCDRLGWDSRSFDVFRCRVEYPLLKTFIDMTLNLAAPAK